MRVLRYPNVFAIAALILAALVMILEFSYLRPLTGGLVGLDLRMDGFKPAEAINYVMMLGPRGRETLLVWHYLTLDLFLPAAIALALAGYTFHLLQHFSPFSQWSDRKLGIASLIWVLPYLLADYGQNILISGVLANPIGLSHSAIRAASVLGILKFIFLFIGIAFLGVLSSIRKIRKRGR